MFEHSLIDLEEKKQPRRRWTSLPIALGLHLAVVATVGFANVWQVDEKLADPRIVDPLRSERPVPVIFEDAQPPQGPKTPVQTTEVVKTRSGPVQPDEKTVPEKEPGPTTTIPAVEDLTPATDARGDSSLSGTDPRGKGTVPGGDPDSDNLTGGPKVAPEEAEPEVKSVAIRVGGAVKRPELLSGPQPRYSELARKAGLHGVVILEAIIDEEGRVTNLEILKSVSRELDQAALDAVRQWRYQPATLENRAVKVIFNLTVNFQLQR